ncbi:MAG: sigma 54-interacting transcriptional regulator [Acidobacteria bacterium]|nr:sigma 54-interacting transcriptional regulator [Acidobacteriota bacterium]
MDKAKRTPLDTIRERVEEMETGLETLQQQLAEAAGSGVDPKLLVTLTRQSLSAVRKEELEEIRQALKGLEISLQEARVGRLSKRLADLYFRAATAEELLNAVVDDLMQETRSERAAIVLCGEDTREAKVVTIRNFRTRELEAAEHTLSRTLLKKVFESGQSFLLADASADPDLWRESSIYLRLGCALVAPMKVGDLMLGAIYLENNSATCVYTEADRQFLEAIGNLIAVYLETTHRLDLAIRARDEAMHHAQSSMPFPDIIGNSPKLRRVLQIVEQVADSNATVLIEGESGTGKELIARAVHQRSARAPKPFVVLNCAAVPDTLVESELFGHEKGAFTGAHERKIGRFEWADGGTIFLDEIGELTLPVQAKLLRVLQIREFERLGSTKTLSVDVRVIAATSRNLKQMVDEGTFQEALYYRLNVIPVQLPPLRERREDIPLLANFFLKKFLGESAAKVRFDREAVLALEGYDFPGNIRELENVVQRLVLLRSGDLITVLDLPDYITGEGLRVIDLEKNPFRHYMGSAPKDNEDLQRRRAAILQIAQEHIEELENQMIEKYLQMTGGNIAEAARLSGLHRSMFYRKRRPENPPPSLGQS